VSAPGRETVLTITPLVQAIVTISAPGATAPAVRPPAPVVLSVAPEAS
jgi:hypothetical protein